MDKNTDHVRDIIQRLSTGSKADSNNLKEVVEKISVGSGVKTEDYPEIDTVGKIVAKISDQVAEFQNRILGDAIEAWGFKKSDVENALIELEQYREIGTVEECRAQNRVHVETALIFITPSRPLRYRRAAFKENTQ